MAFRPNFSCLKYVKFIVNNSIHFNIANGPCVEQWEHQEWQHRQFVRQTMVCFIVREMTVQINDRSPFVLYADVIPDFSTELNVFIIYYYCFIFVICICEWGRIYHIRLEFMWNVMEYFVGWPCALFVWFTVSWNDGDKNCENNETVFTGIVSYECDKYLWHVENNYIGAIGVCFNCQTCPTRTRARRNVRQYQYSRTSNKHYVDSRKKLIIISLSQMTEMTKSTDLFLVVQQWSHRRNTWLGDLRQMNQQRCRIAMKILFNF